MKATIWGCRGSLAAPGPETRSSTAGTRPASSSSWQTGRRSSSTPAPASGSSGASSRRATEPILLCLTHLHLDHLEGLGFFVPLWQPERELHIWGPASPVDALEERIARYLSPPLFPVQLSEVPANLTSPRPARR